MNVRHYELRHISHKLRLTDTRLRTNTLTLYVFVFLQRGEVPSKKTIYATLAVLNELKVTRKEGNNT